MAFEKSNKRAIFLFFVLMLFIISLFPIVAAQRESSSIGGSISKAFDFISDILNAKIKLPNKGYLPYYHRNQTIPLGVFAGVFMIIYSIIFTVTRRIPMFKEEGAKNAAIAFSIAFTLISILASPIVEMAAKMVAVTGELGAVALFVIALVVIAGLFALTPKAWRWTRGELKDVENEERKKEGEQKRKEEEKEELAEEQLNAAEKRALSRLEGMTTAEIYDTQKMIDYLNLVKRILQQKGFDLTRPNARSQMAEILKKIRGSEEELEKKFPFIKKSEAELAKLLKAEITLMEDDEKNKISGLMGARGVTVGSGDVLRNIGGKYYLNNLIISQLKKEIAEFKEGITKNNEEILKREREFIGKYNEFIAYLQSTTKRKGSAAQIIKAIDEMIVIKTGQKKFLDRMLKAERVMDYLESQEIAEGIAELRNTTTLLKTP